MNAPASIALDFVEDSVKRHLSFMMGFKVIIQFGLYQPLGDFTATAGASTGLYAVWELKTRLQANIRAAEATADRIAGELEHVAATLGSAHQAELEQMQQDVKAAQDYVRGYLSNLLTWLLVRAKFIKHSKRSDHPLCC